MTATAKAYRGIGMEGAVATWYARNTGRDSSRFVETARVVASRAPAGGRVLEVAPGPGYLAIELGRRGFQVAAVDISQSFVRMVAENAAKAGVRIDVRHGNAAAMPFEADSFDFVVCTAAFKNFTDPVGALNEIHRVLKPGARASIQDLRQDATADDIAAEIEGMHLSPINALVTRLTFRFVLLKRAYTRAELERMVAASRFGRADIVASGIGFDLQLTK